MIQILFHLDLQKRISSKIEYNIKDHIHGGAMRRKLVEKGDFPKTEYSLLIGKLSVLLVKILQNMNDFGWQNSQVVSVVQLHNYIIDT